MVSGDFFSSLMLLCYCVLHVLRHFVHWNCCIEEMRSLLDLLEFEGACSGPVPSFRARVFRQFGTCARTESQLQEQASKSEAGSAARQAENTGQKLVSSRFRKRRLALWAACSGPVPSFRASVTSESDVWHYGLLAPGPFRSSGPGCLGPNFRQFETRRESQWHYGLLLWAACSGPVAVFRARVFRQFETFAKTASQLQEQACNVIRAAVPSPTTFPGGTCVQQHFCAWHRFGPLAFLSKPLFRRLGMRACECDQSHGRHYTELFRAGKHMVDSSILHCAVDTFLAEWTLVLVHL